jgi:Ca2+-transporting ATPase
MTYQNDYAVAGTSHISNLKSNTLYRFHSYSHHISRVATLIFRLDLPDIFTPVHVIFLELVMGPMCSIVYENEPAEKNSMQKSPRPIGSTFLSLKELGISIVQGWYYYRNFICVPMDRTKWSNEQLTRTMVFTTLVFSNVILSLVNRSFYILFSPL